MFAFYMSADGPLQENHGLQGLCRKKRISSDVNSAYKADPNQHLFLNAS